MKAVAVFPQARDVKLIEKEPPRLDKPDEAMLHILDVGICGTDREIATFEYGTPPPDDDHLVIGHECVAEVIEAGSAVEALQPGDLVLPRCVAHVRTRGASPVAADTRTSVTRATSPSAGSKVPTATWPSTRSTTTET